MAIFYELVGKGWYFSSEKHLCGPYASEQHARAKFEEWQAYVLDAPACHHPHSEGSDVQS